MPITIGPFTDVPAPDDPVASAWAQEITQFAVDDITIGPAPPASANGELWYDTTDLGISFPNMPRGFIGRGTQAGAQNGIGTVDTDVTGATVTWTADPARRYRYTARILAQKITSAGDVFAYITDGANARLVGAGQSAGVNGWVSLYIEGIQSGLSGSTTRKLRISTTVATVNLGTNEYLGNVTVEDIGGV